MRAWWLALAACGSPAPATPDAATPPPMVTITATADSTRFVVREHMLAAAEMQISGEPLAETMGRDLGGYSRIHIPADLYFDGSPYAAGPWIDLPGFSTAVESYEYSKQPMNALAFELGAGTTLANADMLVQKYAAESDALGHFVYPQGTYPPVPAVGAANPLGWPGMWPTVHVFASFDPTIAPTGQLDEKCSISSDDNPGEAGGVNCADYECDASTLHLTNRAAQIDSAITPGADGFTTWKYALWTLNYLQIMHDASESAVDSVDEADLAAVGTPGGTTFLGSSRIEGFQAAMFITMIDQRAQDWLGALATADGATLSGFASVSDALAYDDSSPLRWFPARVAVTETDNGGLFPAPSYALASADSSLLDLTGVALGYATFFALTDTRNASVGGSQPARVYFDGDPFDAGPMHDRALAMIKVAVVDMDRMHRDPASGVFVDDVTAGQRGTTLSTTSAAYALIALRTVQRTLASQLELYSNNTPDTHGVSSPLGTDFDARLDRLVRAHAALLYEHLTDDTGRAYAGWNVAAGTPADQSDVLDAHAAAVRGLFAAYLATGDVKYRDRALAVFARMRAVFYDRDARIFSVTPAPADTVTYTPVRFALVQSALRDVYELTATRPGNEDMEPELEELIGRLDKLVLNGWDDRNYDRQVQWPTECVNVVDMLPRGGLQMAERTLTGEIGIFEEHVLPGRHGTSTSDREGDCVPEIDDARLPAALADSVTFRIARGP